MSTLIRTRWIAIAVACVGGGRVPAQTDDRPVRFPIEVPFEMTSSKPFVQVRVNDSEPLWFVLDTGDGGSCAVDRTRAKALGLVVEGERVRHVGAGDGIDIPIGTARGVTIRLPGLALPNLSVTVMPLDHVSAFEGRRMDGLLGHDFIRRFVVEIDYAARKVRLHDPDAFEYSGPGTVVPIRFNHGMIVVRGGITPPGRDAIPCAFIMDTGARAALMLNRPFVEKHGLTRAMPDMRRATVGGGAGGESRGLVGRLASMRFGPFLVRAPVVVCSEDRTGALTWGDVAGIVGGPLLSRCRVFLDYRRERIVLEPYARAPTPYEYDKSGLFLVAEAPDFSTFKVLSVMDDSPADDVGIRRGDAIVAVNGRPSSAWSLDEFRRMLMAAGRTVEVEIQRRDARMKALIRTRALIE